MVAWCDGAPAGAGPAGAHAHQVEIRYQVEIQGKGWAMIGGRMGAAGCALRQVQLGLSQVQMDLAVAHDDRWTRAAHHSIWSCVA